MNISNTSTELIEAMNNITKCIAPDIFYLDPGVLIISATGQSNAAGSCAQVSYKILDEIDAIEYLKQLDIDLEKISNRNIRC